MGHLEYLAVLGLCLLVTLPLELVLGARVWRCPRRLARAVLPVAAVFAVWDVIAIRLGHWRFNPKLVTGVELPLGLPVDEVVFFVGIPICALLTFEVVRRMLARFAP
jgi:lycopene cyclase domain-containing protein